MGDDAAAIRSMTTDVAAFRALVTTEPPRSSPMCCAWGRDPSHDDEVMTAAGDRLVDLGWARYEQPLERMGVLYLTERGCAARVALLNVLGGPFDDDEEPNPSTETA